MKIFDFLDRMSNITRWSQMYCSQSESVLEHTAVVAFFGLLIADKYKLNKAVILEAAIVHDMDEIVTGDIPTPTKYANKEITESIKALETAAARDISYTIFDSDDIFNAWLNAKDSSLEGDAIRIADAAAVVFKVRKELNVGNRTFYEIVPNIKKALTKMEGRVNPLLVGEIEDLIHILIDLEKAKC
jgi:5'-deoxynucleotidase